MTEEDDVDLLISDICDLPDISIKEWRYKDIFLEWHTETNKTLR